MSYTGPNAMSKRISELEGDLREVIAAAIRRTAKISATCAWEGTYTSLNEAQIVNAVVKAIAELPMHCDCTKKFKDWPLSDQLVSKAREAVASTVPPADGGGK